jgi:hypothetical protein
VAAMAPKRKQLWTCRSCGWLHPNDHKKCNWCDGAAAGASGSESSAKRKPAVMFDQSVNVCYKQALFSAPKMPAAATPWSGWIIYQATGAKAAHKDAWCDADDDDSDGAPAGDSAKDEERLMHHRRIADWTAEENTSTQLTRVQSAFRGLQY